MILRIKKLVKVSRNSCVYDELSQLISKIKLRKVLQKKQVKKYECREQNIYHSFRGCHKGDPSKMKRIVKGTHSVHA
jgi:rRNA-processing protein FCF1